MGNFDPFARKVNRQLLPFERAYEVAMSYVKPIGAETIDIFHAAGRILAENIFADADFPPFDKSVVDGFACRRRDLGNVLTIVEEIPAGAVPKRQIGENECAKIMTGAPVPPGADIVVMVEETQPVGENRIKFVGENPQTNIYFRGSDVRRGDLLIPAGTRIFPHHIPVLASVGKHKIAVSRRPKVGIIVTGDEIVEPAETPAAGQIRNTNAYLLWAQTETVGGIPSYYGISPDEPEKFRELLAKSIAENDITLVSGGVSMGEYDIVPDVFRALGLEIKFDRLAIKPGRPTTFAVSDDAVAFGLPGNPVSSFVAFEILVKPFLFAMMGHKYEPLKIVAPLGVEFSRRIARRDERIPAKFGDDGRVYPVEYHGSAHFQALIHADGLIMIPRGVHKIPAGEKVEVYLIRWN